MDENVDFYEKNDFAKSENPGKTPRNKQFLRNSKTVEKSKLQISKFPKIISKTAREKTDYFGKVRFTAYFEKCKNRKNKKVRSFVLFWGFLGVK